MGSWQLPEQKAAVGRRSADAIGWGEKVLRRCWQTISRCHRMGGGDALSSGPKDGFRIIVMGEVPSGWVGDGSYSSTHERCARIGRSKSSKGDSMEQR